MKNDLAYFAPPEYSDLGLYWIGFVISGIGLFVSGIGMIPPFSGMWTVYLAIVCVLTIIAHIIGFKTHIMRELSSGQYSLWKTYQSLPAELQKQIPMSLDTVKSVRDPGVLDTKLEDLRLTHNNRLREEALLSAPDGDIRRAIDDVMHNELAHIDTSRNLVKQLREGGYIQ